MPVSPLKSVGREGLGIKLLQFAKGPGQRGRLRRVVGDRVNFGPVAGAKQGDFPDVWKLFDFVIN